MVNNGDIKVKWNHFGSKQKFIITTNELQEDAFQALLNKIYQFDLNFNGILAYINSHGNQTIMATEEEFRELISESRGRIKIYTIQLPQQNLLKYPHRSQSAPMDFNSRPYQRPGNSQQGPPPPYHKIYYDNPIVHSPRSMISRYSQMASPGCNVYGFYSQPLIYGMPPHSLMIRSLLCSPFPFGSYHRSWSRDSKCCAWGGKYHRNGYFCEWGPIF